MSHPFYYTQSILPPEAISEHYHGDSTALKARVLAACAAVLSASEEDLPVAFAHLHAVSGLHDSTCNQGRACGLVTDLINV